MAAMDRLTRYCYFVILLDVKHLVHFIRSPTWIVPPRIPTMMLGPCREILSQIELDEKENFTPTQIEKFQKDPEFYKKFTKITEKEVNSNFPIVSRIPLC